MARRGSLVVRGVDEVSAGFVVCVEKLEAALLVHRTPPKLVPLVADVRGAELDGRDMESRVGCKLAVTAEFGARQGRRLENGSHWMSCERFFCKSVKSSENQIVGASRFLDAHFILFRGWRQSAARVDGQ